MKLTVLENGKVRIGFREQIEVAPEDVKEELRKLCESLGHQFATIVEVYESAYFKGLALPTIVVSDTGVSTSATFPKKEEEAENETAEADNGKA